MRPRRRNVPSQGDGFALVILSVVSLYCFIGTLVAMIKMVMM
jgi:hypothetical protein